MKTVLKSLEMKGLRSFAEPTSIQFPENGLVLLMGPSGSGKSSVFLGVAYGMGYCPYPASELQSWYGDEKLEVKLGLSTKDGDLTIVRGPKSFVEGAVNVQGASNINPTIAKLTGLDQELLAALTYRPQKTPGLFLSKTNAEMQEFLSILLGLNKFDRAIEQCNEQIKGLGSQLEAQTILRPKWKQAWETAEAIKEPGLHDPADFKRQVESANAISSKLMADLQLQTEKIKDFRAEWSKKQSAFMAEKQRVRQSVPVSPVSGRVSTELLEAERFQNQVLERLSRLIKQNDDRKNEVALEMASVNAKIRALTLINSQVNEAELKVERLQEEVKTIRACRCPKCEQTWVNSKANSALVKANEEIEDLTEWLNANRDVGDDINHLEQRLAELQHGMVDDPKIAKMREVLETARLATQVAKDNLAKQVAEEKLTEQKALSDALAGVMEREKAATDVYLTEVGALEAVREALQEEYNKAENAWNQARFRLNQIEVENKSALKEQERIRKTKADTKAAYDEVEATIDKLLKQIGEEQDLLEMLKAFLTAIFDEVLEEIAYNANEMMAEVPNVAHITIKFKSETTTAKGTTKRAITPVVNIGGGERPLRSALSGGMASAVELAVDLAVRKVISARSGAIPGWLILDECFEGLGVAEKEACLGLLKHASENTLILVIDHSSETKELFSSTITVENVNGRSKITENTEG